MAKMKDAEIKLKIVVSVETQDAPNLGLATTEELMKELMARSQIQGIEGLPTGDFRFELDRYLQEFPKQFLNYRTVDKS